MKFELYISIIFSLLISPALFSQEKMPACPKYEEVINQFFTRYSTLEVAEDEQFSFAKKPNGWHAMVRKFNSNEVIKDELFWSRSDKEYLEIKFPFYVQALTDPNHEQMLNDSWAKLSSSLVTYWGYNGWEKDVFNEFGNKKKLSDSLLNGLARAYSSYARSLISRSEFGNNNLYDKLPKGQNALSSSLLEEYLKYQHLSIATYHKLYKQNAKFETFVADIFNVYSNEIMNGFLSLRYLQNEETALKELKPGLYDGFYLEMARNYLNSCEKDAILFTNGDLDTYPLLYVQSNENYRKDVLVINLSLLNLGRYISHLTTIKSGANPLKINMDPEIYKNETKDFFYIIEKLTNPLLFTELLDFIQSKDTTNKIQLSDKQWIEYIPSKDMYFKSDPQNIGNDYIDYNIQVDSVVFIHLAKNYVLLSEFCMLDILASNSFKRPVYFASTVSGERFECVSDYLSYEGMVYRLLPTTIERQENEVAEKIYPEILYNRLIHRLKFEKKNYRNLLSSNQNILNNYFLAFSRLTDSYMNGGNTDKALLVMDYFRKTFPSNDVKYNYYIYPFISNYFKAGKNDEAIKMLKTCINCCKSELESLINVKNKVSNDEKLTLEVFSLRELQNISSIYIPNHALINEINELVKKYDANQTD